MEPVVCANVWFFCSLVFVGERRREWIVLCFVFNKHFFSF